MISGNISGTFFINLLSSGKEALHILDHSSPGNKDYRKIVFLWAKQRPLTPNSLGIITD